MPTTIEIKVNDAVWISVDLNAPLDKKTIQEIDAVFKKVITDKNADSKKLEGFLISPKVVKGFVREVKK